MYIDSNLILSDQQTVLTTATSTYYVDMLSAGFGHNDELYAQFIVDGTNLGVTTTASLTLAIWVANETSLASQSLVIERKLLMSEVPGISSTTIATGNVLATMHIGPDVFKLDAGSGDVKPYKYIYARYTCSVAMTGAFSCLLLKDIDMTMDKVK